MIRVRSVLVAFALLILASPVAAAEGSVEVSGRVVHADGSPVAGAQLSTHWRFQDGRRVVTEPPTHLVADREGRFHGSIEPTSKLLPLIAYTRDDAAAGHVLVDRTRPTDLVVFVRPTIAVRINVKRTDLGRAPDWIKARWMLCAHTSLAHLGGKFESVDRIQFAVADSHTGAIHLRLPGGGYDMELSGQDSTKRTSHIHLSPQRSELELHLDLTAPAAPPPQSRSQLVEQSQASVVRVVVIPSDGASDPSIAGSMRAWKAAGTPHVGNISFAHPERGPGWIRLASIVEIAGPGPHSLLAAPGIREALEAFKARGGLLVGAPPATQAVLEEEQPAQR